MAIYLLTSNTNNINNINNSNNNNIKNYYYYYYYREQNKTVSSHSLWNFVEQQDKYFSKNQFSRRRDYGNKPKC